MYLPELFEFLETTMQIILNLIKTSQHRMIHCINSGASKSQKQSWSASTDHLVTAQNHHHPLQCAGLHHYICKVVGYCAEMHVFKTLLTYKLLQTGYTFNFQ